EVKQDQLLARVRHAQEQYDSLLEVASEPGLSDAEVDVAAYKMSQINKTKDRAEQELQDVLTRMAVIDSTLDYQSEARAPEDGDLEEDQRVLSISKSGTDRDPRELLLWRGSAELPDGPVVAPAPIDRP
ncbi:MAG: hypothetical protein V1246_06350, partial [Arenicellales bacterium]|nr:hypothetical protein [Arenicellales bacterium]